MLAFVDTPFEQLIVQAVLQIPAEIVILGYSLRLFDIRNKIGFLLVAASLFVGTSLCANFFPSSARLFMSLFIFVLPQLAFSKDSVVRRLFTAVVMQIAIVLAEIPPSVYWLGITTVSPASIEAMTQYTEYLFLARIIHLGALVLLFMGVELAQRRITSNRTNRGSLLFFSFLILQYLMLALGIFAIEATKSFSSAAAVGLAVVGMLCLIADVFCFVMLDRYNRSEREYQRMVFFQEQLDHYLEGYEGIEREVAAIARIRHDLRNQISVVLYFLDGGDVVAARDHVNEFAERLREDEAASSIENMPELTFKEKVSDSRLSSAGDSFQFEEGPIGIVFGDGFRMVPSLGLNRFASAGQPARSSAGQPARSSAGQPAFHRAHYPTYLYYSLYGVFPLSQIATLGYLLGYAAAASLPLWFYLIIILMCALCALSDLVLFRVMREYRQRGAIESKARLMEDQAHIQRQYYERLSVELKEAVSARHRLVRQLFTIEGELAKGNVGEVRDLLRETASTPSFAGERFCENRVVNALLSLKSSAMAAEGIKFDFATNVPDNLPVPSVDLCALFSNMLDNALAACRQVGEGERFVELRSTLSAGVFTVDMVNSSVDDSQGAASAKKKFRSSGTVKAWDLARMAGLLDEDKLLEIDPDDSLVNRHGWGLQILRDLANRYDGAFASARLPEGGFRTTIMLMLRSC